MSWCGLIGGELWFMCGHGGHGVLVAVVAVGGKGTPPRITTPTLCLTQGGSCRGVVMSAHRVGGWSWQSPVSVEAQVTLRPIQWLRPANNQDEGRAAQVSGAEV